MKPTLIAATILFGIALEASAQTTLDVRWTDNTGGVNNGHATLRYNSGPQYGINHAPPHQGGYYGSNATPFGRYTPFPKPITTGWAGGPTKIIQPPHGAVRLMKIHMQDRNVVVSICAIPVFHNPYQQLEPHKWVTVDTFRLTGIGDQNLKNLTHRHVQGGLGIDVTFRITGT